MMEPKICDGVQSELRWLLDDELESDSIGTLQQHVGECRACQRFLETEAARRDSLKEAARVACPPELRQRVSAVLHGYRQRSRGWALSVAAAAAASVLAVVGWGVNSKWANSDTARLLEVAERHQRDLPLDVVAGDLSQIPDLQRFFRSRLSFPVELPEVNPVRYLGGRITHVGDRDAAYVRYETPHGRVSLWVYQDPRVIRVQSPRETAENGEWSGRQPVVMQRVGRYTVASWRRGELTYSAVSELPAQQMAAVLTSSLP